MAANLGNLQNLINSQKGKPASGGTNRATGKSAQPQTLRGNGASQPSIQRDAPMVQRPDKGKLSNARKRALANLTQAEEKSPSKKRIPGGDGGAVDSPLGVRGSSSQKKNPFLRVN